MINVCKPVGGLNNKQLNSSALGYSRGEDSRIMENKDLKNNKFGAMEL